MSQSIKDQTQGIAHIRDITNQLEAITQENAAIANQTDVIAQSMQALFVILLKILRSISFNSNIEI
ncbi:hypothetical protein NHP164001_08230 [Helicobacter trogontum]|uniref:Methyl-accepting chemotaxis protein n=1 Tax=Helicobacter trogontum TaxID=50960 RepID=A0ABQ0D398_9HELI